MSELRFEFSNLVDATKTINLDELKAAVHLVRNGLGDTRNAELLICDAVEALLGQVKRDGEAIYRLRYGDPGPKDNMQAFE